jgi:glucosamine-6-phosphate deaminase
VEVVIVPGAHDAAELVADVIGRVLASSPAPVIGLATGSSPLGAYRALIERYRCGALSFAGASAVLLDEYLGLPEGHPESYRAFIRRELVDHVDLDPERLHGPDPACADVPAACARYEAQLVELGGVDVQVLGIGSDGHIGFNEPGSSLASRTRIKTLTDETRRDNARFFPSLDDVPHHVVTQGLATIRDARHLLLVATGPAKAAPIARAVEGPLTAMCPASVLQLHPHVTVVVDEAAAADLAHAGYYRDVYAGKPAWQPL